MPSLRVSVTSSRPRGRITCSKSHPGEPFAPSSSSPPSAGSKPRPQSKKADVPLTLLRQQIVPKFSRAMPARDHSPLLHRSFGLPAYYTACLQKEKSWWGKGEERSEITCLILLLPREPDSGPWLSLGVSGASGALGPGTGRADLACARCTQPGCPLPHLMPR